VELGTLRLESARLERELATSRRALAATWGASVPDFDEAAGTLTSSEPAPDAEDLLARVDEFPSVALERARAVHARAEVNAAIASSRSDLALEAGVRRFEETGDYAGLFSVGLPLPIADRKSAAGDAARSREAAAEAHVTAARRDAETAVRTLAFEIASAEEEARTLDATLVPEARLARDESEIAYASGLFRFTDVLNAQHTLADLSMRSIDAKARALELRAELARITGVPAPTEEEVR
jgi:cobalt-zinc-cadmium efflux system outer membrane protein